MFHQIEVEFSTHDDLEKGIVCLGMHRVNVIADSEIEAMEIAYLMVHSRGFYPTRVDYVL